MKHFQTEATTLARLHHSDIATIHEIHRTDTDLLMVMEFVKGETLEHLVAAVWAAAGRARRLSRGAGARRPRTRAQRRRRPSRPDAVQHHRHRTRQHQGDGFRHGARRGSGPGHLRRICARTTFLYVAGAALGRGGRRSHRRLFGGRDFLSTLDRATFRSKRRRRSKWSSSSSPVHRRRFKPIDRICRDGVRRSSTVRSHASWTIDSRQPRHFVRR